MKKTIYLASPYGFSKQWKSKLLPDFVTQLESMGLDVWEPFSRNNQVDTSKKGWAYEIAVADRDDVRNADGLFAIINGTPPDEGVMVELGIAIALKKPIFLFRDDFRLCSDSEEYPLNLMIFSGHPEDTWRDYYYTDIADITNTEKELSRWAKQGS
ncbi:MAG: nucleoside 2-deoxyribosyltransferase [Planctomycetes bacterium]|nr:nucleoside 2-deoxyribosyltransferase [Planctomycetota bacterium]